MAHPEEPAAADAGAADNASKDEDEAVKKQLMASLGTDEVPKLEVLPHAHVVPLPCKSQWHSMCSLPCNACMTCKSNHPVLELSHLRCCA